MWANVIYMGICKLRQFQVLSLDDTILARIGYID